MDPGRIADGTDDPRVIPRWLRFSLRTLFVVVTVLACWLGWILHRAKQQTLAISAVEKIGGHFYYEYQYEPPNGWYADRKPPGPSWLWNVVRKDTVFDVVGVGLNSKPATDETVSEVCRLGNLQVLDLAGASDVTDKSMVLLSSLNRLTYLRLDGTSVTERAVSEYRSQHPGVDVTWYSQEDLEQSRTDWPMD